MYKNIFDEAKEVKDGCFKLSSNGDVVRVVGSKDVTLDFYDSDGNFIGKVKAI